MGPGLRSRTKKEMRSDYDQKKEDRLCIGCFHGDATLNEYGFYNCNICAVTLEEVNGLKRVFIHTPGEKKEFVKNHTRD